MFVTLTWNVPAGSTVIDLFSFAVNSTVPVDDTPSFDALLHNGGAGTLRVGAVTDINVNSGVPVGPGETFQLRVHAGHRIGLVGDGGTAAGAISAILQSGAE
jgi:hypothetical protein